MNPEAAVADLYERLIHGWNRRDARLMAAAIAPDGLVIGFDGSQMLGRKQVVNDLGQIFSDHQTASYVTKIRATRSLAPGAALLHAVAGMIPPGGSQPMPDRNAVQTVVASEDEDGWSAALFQTTPAQFHGRPELAAALTAELTELLR
jgi:uncharacterized protein (TIGR02246 family)